MTEPEKHDWQQIIFEVRAMYLVMEGRELSNHRLGEMLGMDHKSVDILRKRGEPRHRPGQLLLELHAQYFRETALKPTLTNHIAV